MAISERDLNLNMVFTTAIEGGINYWARIVDYKWSDNGEEIAEFFAEIQEFDADDKTKIRLVTRHTITKGITRAYKWMTEGPGRPDSYQFRAISDLNFGKWDDVDYDALTADIIVQFGLYGELIYG